METVDASRCVSELPCIANIAITVKQGLGLVLYVAHLNGHAAKT